jgi:hypothetical protein
MFFSAKYRNRGGANAGRGNRRGGEQFVIEGGASAQVLMSSANFKFDCCSPAAISLQAAIFEKIKGIW